VTAALVLATLLLSPPLLALAPAPGATPAAKPARATPEAVAPGEPTAAATPQPEGAPAPEGEAEPDPALDPLDPESQALVDAMLARLGPADRAAFEAMGEAGWQELMEKIGRGSPLTPQEQAIAEALNRAMAEQFEAGLHYETGDVEIGHGLAVLHLGDRFRYLDAAQAERVLVDAWGNPRGQAKDTLGMILPVDVSPLDAERGWGVVITYSNDGHVEDDDAQDIDYDELLAEMQQATEAENPSRRAQGYAGIRLVGWAEPPHYDEASHRLYWAKELAFEDTPEGSLNYAIRVLGRRGVLELNAVAPMSQLHEIKPAMEEVLSRVDLTAGNRYEDFDPGIDRVAAYGIGGLIAGKALAKTGLLAGLLKVLLAAKKLLLVGAIAIAVVLKRWLGRKDAA